ERRQHDLQPARAAPEQPDRAHLGAACEDEQRQRLCLEERKPRVAREHRIRKAERGHPEPERRHRAEAVTEHPTQPSLGVARGAALYVGALIGPGVLLVPALAVQAAGPASIISWGALLVFSAPLAMTFAALGVRHPVAGGVAAYVREGLGDAAAAV